MPDFLVKRDDLGASRIAESDARQVEPGQVRRRVEPATAHVLSVPR